MKEKKIIDIINFGFVFSVDPLHTKRSFVSRFVCATNLIIVYAYPFESWLSLHYTFSPFVYLFFLFRFYALLLPFMFSPYKFIFGRLSVRCRNFCSFMFLRFSLPPQTAAPNTRCNLINNFIKYICWKSVAYRKWVKIHVDVTATVLLQVESSYQLHEVVQENTSSLFYFMQFFFVNEHRY